MSNIIELNEKQIELVKMAIEKACNYFGYKNVIEPYVRIDKESKIYNFIWEMTDSSSHDSKRFSFLILAGKPKDGESILHFVIVANNKFSYEELFVISGVFYGDDSVTINLKKRINTCYTFSLPSKEDHIDACLSD